MKFHILFKSKELEIEYNKKKALGTLKSKDLHKYYDLSDQQLTQSDYIIDEWDLLQMYREAGSPEINYFMNQLNASGDAGRAHYIHGDTLTTKQRMDYLMKRHPWEPNPTIKFADILNPANRHNINIYNPISSPFLNNYTSPGNEKILNQTIEELAHAYQYSNENVPGYEKYYRPTSVDIDGNIVQLTDSVKGMCYDNSGNPTECGKYAFPGQHEHQAHSSLAPKLASIFGTHVGSNTIDADEVGYQPYYITEDDGTIRLGKTVNMPSLSGTNYFKEDELPEGYTLDMFDFSGLTEENKDYWTGGLKEPYYQELIDKLREEDERITKEKLADQKYGGQFT